MGVFGGHDGTVCSAFTDAVEPLGVRILRDVHIGVPFPNGTFVADGPVHPVFFPAFDPEVGLVEIVSVAGFVAQGPDADAGLVFVSFVVVDGTVHVRGQPGRVVAQGASLAQVVVHAVGFNVGFVVHIQSHFVAEFVETAALGIVAEADRIDVVLFHQRQVLADALKCYVVSGHRVVFVCVHSFHLDRLSVKEEEDVCSSGAGVGAGGADFKPAEADGVGNEFFGSRFVSDVHHQAVEARGFCRPGLDVGQFRIPGHGRLAVCPEGDLLRGLPYGISLSVFQVGRVGGCFVAVVVVFEVGLQFPDAVGVGVIQGGEDFEVADGSARLGPQIYIPFDSADPPEILAFQVRTGAPTEDFQHQGVLARLKVGVDAEFGRGFGVFAVTDFLAVQVHVNPRFGTVEVQENGLAGPVCRYFKFGPVHADRVGFWQGGRSGIAGFEFVAVVGINGGSKALDFPVAGHLDVAPVVGVASRVGDVGRQFLVGFYEEEFPGPVQRAVAAAFKNGPVLGCWITQFGCRSRGITHERRSGVFPVFGHNIDVLPVGQGFCIGRERTDGPKAQQEENSFHKIYFIRTTKIINIVENNLF